MQYDYASYRLSIADIIIKKRVSGNEQYVPVVVPASAAVKDAAAATTSSCNSR